MTKRNPYKVAERVCTILGWTIVGLIGVVGIVTSIWLLVVQLGWIAILYVIGFFAILLVILVFGYMYVRAEEVWKERSRQWDERYRDDG
jgi:pilus assembly protein TadC